MHIYLFPSKTPCHFPTAGTQTMPNSKLTSNAKQIISIVIACLSAFAHATQAPQEMEICTEENEDTKKKRKYRKDSE